MLRVAPGATMPQGLSTLASSTHARRSGSPAPFVMRSSVARSDATDRSARFRGAQGGISAPGRVSGGGVPRGIYG